MFPSLRLIMSGASVAAILLMAAVPGLLSREIGVQSVSLGGLQRALSQPAIGDNPDAQHFQLLGYARRAEELERLALHPFAGEGILHMREKPSDIVSLRFSHLPASPGDAIPAPIGPSRQDIALAANDATAIAAIETPVTTLRPEPPPVQEPSVQARQAPVVAPQAAPPDVSANAPAPDVQVAAVQAPQMQEPRLQESAVQKSLEQVVQPQALLTPAPPTPALPVQALDAQDAQAAAVQTATAPSETTQPETAPSETAQAQKAQDEPSPAIQMAALVTRDADRPLTETVEGALLTGAVPLPRNAPGVRAAKRSGKAIVTVKKQPRVAAAKKIKRAVIVRRRPVQTLTSGPGGTFTPDVQASNQQR